MTFNKIQIIILLIQVYLANVEKIIFDIPIKTDYSTDIPTDLELIKFENNNNSRRLKIDSLPKNYLLTVDSQQEHGRYELRLVNVATSPINIKFDEVCTNNLKGKYIGNLTEAGNCFIILSLNQNNFVKNKNIKMDSYMEVELVLDPMLKVFGIQLDIPKTALPTIWFIVCSLPVALIWFKPLLNSFIMDTNN